MLNTLTPIQCTAFNMQFKYMHVSFNNWVTSYTDITEINEQVADKY